MKNSEKIGVAVFIVIVASYMFWYSSKVEDIALKCKPNFEEHTCDF